MRNQTPVPCRACDYKGATRCKKYDRAFSTMRRWFDAGLCYGRTVQGEKQTYPDK